jgi:hypothetical protein
VTEATYDSNRGGDGSNFGNPTFEAPVNIKARQNEPGTETVCDIPVSSFGLATTQDNWTDFYTTQVVVGPRSNTNTAGRTQYTNNTGGIATVYGNATYKKEYNVN